MKHLKYITEYNKELKTPQGVWRVKPKPNTKAESKPKTLNSTTIDLDDVNSEMKINNRYNFLGITFTPKYNGFTNVYYTMIQKEGFNNMSEIYTSWVIYSNDLSELKHKIRFKIKEYLKAVEEDTINDNKDLKHLKKYELFLEYNSEIQNKIDVILDKISKSGINSLYPEEKELLDSYNKGSEETEKSLSKLTDKENEKEYRLKDYNGNAVATFTFKRTETVNINGQLLNKYYGTMSFPDIIQGDGEVIEGTVDGYIIEQPITKTFDVQFNKEGYTIFDFMEGFEYETDNFIIDILSDINQGS